MDWTIFVTFVTIYASIANVKKQKISFVIYLITDVIWFVVDWRAGLYGQAFLFVVYMVLAIWGWNEWTKNPPK